MNSDHYSKTELCEYLEACFIFGMLVASTLMAVLSVIFYIDAIEEEIETTYQELCRT